MEIALAKLHNFCNENSILYCVTGTVALSLLGVPSDHTPHDIDIKVYDLTDAQLQALRGLSYLSGMNNHLYPDSECISFPVNGITVNALVQKNAPEAVLAECIALYEEVAPLTFTYVQKVEYALRDKMKLNRDKDTKYLLNLIKKLCSLCQK